MVEDRDRYLEMKKIGLIYQKEKSSQMNRSGIS
jgi:hypothetical protein